MSARVAFVGKGGAGKSLVAATVARLLGRRGPVLALDLDTMPGLAHSLGVEAGPEGLPEDLAERREGEGWVMRVEVSPEDLVARHGIYAPDNVRLLVLGKLPGHVRPGSTTAFRHVAMGFHKPGWSVIGDLAAGTRQAFFGWAGFARTVVIVVEPSVKSLISARRLALLRDSVPARFVAVVNKVRSPAEAARLAEQLGLPLAATVPYDPLVRDAEKAGWAPLDAVPDAPAIAAIRELVEEVAA